MRFAAAFLVLAAISTAPALLVGCSSDPAPTADTESAGSLQVPLVAVGSRGNTYRLSQASFSITETMTSAATVLSGDDFLNEEVASVDLPVGTYDVLLTDGWVLEQLDAGNNTFVPVDAVLVSDNPVTTSIQVDSVSSVSFLFRFADEEIPLATGSLAISFDVEEVPVNWTCSPSWYFDTFCDCECGAYDPTCDDPSATPFGCAPGQFCGSDATCHESVCGDGAKSPIEDCDDGNLQGGDGCPSTCLFSEPPETWTCPGFFWDDGGCDCECGAIDPDCSNPEAAVFGCQAGQVCEAGVCVSG